MQNEGHSGPSRRNLVKGAAWAVPAVAAAAAAPAAAVSLRKDPGINGWVNIGRSRSRCTITTTVNSTLSGSGPDGAPFGLYIYDVNPDDQFSDAEMIVWLPSNVTNPNLSWSTQGGHSSCWNGPTYIGTEQKGDGVTYGGYRWTYTCSIDAANVQTDSDGVERLYLGNFHMRTSYTLTENCSSYNEWIQRRIKINGVDFCFERGDSQNTNDCSGQPRPQGRSAGAGPLGSRAAQIEVDGVDNTEVVEETAHAR